MMYRVDGSYLPRDQCPMADVLLGSFQEFMTAKFMSSGPMDHASSSS